MTDIANIKSFAYLKYFGKSVDQGLLDSRKAADALLGFDTAIRFYMAKEEPLLKNVQYDFPVAIQRGSWEILIPENIENLVKIVGEGVVLTTYLRSLAKKAAEDGFFEAGPAKDAKKIIASAIKAIQWTIAIAKKTGNVGVTDQEKTKLFDSETVEIHDSNGSLLVPLSYYRLYEETPRTLFSQAASVIDSERELEIGITEGGSESIATIGIHEKHIFYTLPDNEDIVVLPELEHCQYVELEGEITRCTATANTIGFLYKGHILTCKPESGSISSFKSRIIAPATNQIFRSVLIKGTVVRRSVDGEYKEKKPHIVFTDIVPLTTQYQPLLSQTTQGKMDSDDDD